MVDLLLSSLEEDDFETCCGRCGETEGLEPDPEFPHAKLCAVCLPLVEVSPPEPGEPPVWIDDEIDLDEQFARDARTWGSR